MSTSNARSAGKTRKPRIPSYRLHKPSGLAAVRLNGRDVYLGPYGSPESRAAYDRVMAEWLSGGRQAPDPVRRTAVHPEGPPPSALTVAEVMATYLDHARGYYVKDGQPTTELRDIVYSLKPVRTLYGTTPAAAFGPKGLKAVRQAMIDAGLSRSTINQRVGRVVRMFK